MATTTERNGTGRGLGARLRATSKVLPEHARAHNRSLVLQHLFHEGPTSRADLARATSLTRVTISDLVSVLITEGLVEELGTRPGQRVGKPAILVGLRTDAYQIVAVDLTEYGRMRGAVLSLTGEIVVRRQLDIDGRTGDELVDLLTRFIRRLVAAANHPVIGVGVGSPGIVGLDGRVVEAPNRGWYDVPLAEILGERTGLPVHVANDANTAALGEFTYGGGSSGMLVVTVGAGVGAGVVVDGVRVHGQGDAAGEIGHVTVVDDGDECACGRTGCLETVLSVPALRRAVANKNKEDSDAALASAGRVLGVTLAPVVSALNLSEVLLSGPRGLLDGALREAALDTIRQRTMPAINSGLQLRMAALDEDVVLAGAAVLVLSAQLGVS
ncbi:Sugar kinase of the NBD/HSP70 family, may containing an N-terminal HTH domain [Promicromonospora umidemergens]|uniref:ROK family transcriptional regulator n=1 Tax=Promicromonospora umidemergens TaxID=629679 RepID=A0ABP8WQ67_9MICO|nr:ROK family transcriptional regulator [Promicromonospora umidemergens]MCP2283218.1 Sugar kinase of the NBD/HSP70 family, may containing an N-terminal HTH domain [Promicromonospora umidemergens]